MHEIDRKNAFEVANLIPPTFFLVRHAIELALKDLIVVSRELERRRRALKTGTWLEGPKAISAPWTHDLSKLLSIVQLELPEHFQPSWSQLVASIAKFEGADFEWSRFEMLKERSSFSVRQFVPIRRLVRQLERFVQTAVRIGLPPSDWSALEEIEQEIQQLNQQLFAAGVLKL